MEQLAIAGDGRLLECLTRVVQLEDRSIHAVAVLSESLPYRQEVLER